MSDIGPGDVVMCVDGSPPTHPYWKRRRKRYPFSVGRVLRIRALAKSEVGDWGFLFVGHVEGFYERSGAEIVFDPARFRKIDKSDEGFAVWMKSLRPVKAPAIVAATGTAKTAQPAEGEASQSGGVSRIAQPSPEFEQ